MEETNFKAKLKRKIEIKRALLIIVALWVISLLVIYLFVKESLKQMVWKPIIIEKPSTYETVLISGVQGEIIDFKGERLLIKTDKGEMDFSLNANTSLFNKHDVRISNESGFLFSDYLKPGRKVKVFYAVYDNIYLASKIRLLE